MGLKGLLPPATLTLVSERSRQPQNLAEDSRGMVQVSDSVIQSCCCCCLKKNLNAPRPSEHPPVRGIVVSHIQRMGCQPEKTRAGRPR